MTTQISIREFLEKLASDSHTPGGGSVAAVAGAMGAALVCMVGRLTRGENLQEELRELVEKAVAEGIELETLVKLDIAAFDDVMDAIGLPKTTQEEKDVRKKAIERAMVKATCSPLRIMEHSLEVMKLAKKVAEIGNKHAVSDAGVAASMARSAIESGYFNVLINRGSLKDQSFIEDVDKRAAAVLSVMDDLHREIISTVKGRIG